ncbi:hypothetical protein QFZ94_001432 [Paraburkholderia sp. JPY465]
MFAQNQAVHIRQLGNAIQHAGFEAHLANPVQAA